jgi:hypothetical protein
MCFGQPKADDTIQKQQLAEAADARKREDDRQARITSGTDAVNKNFSVFGDTFFNNRRGEYMNYYQPQLDDQFKTAKDQLTFAFANNGTLNSTAAADKQATLQKSYDNERASLLSNADADVATTQNKINTEKSALLSQLQATGNADQASNDALGRTQQMFQQKPAYDPLGDIFTGVVSGIGNYNAGAQAGRQVYSYFGGTKNPRAAASTTVN